MRNVATIESEQKGRYPGLQVRRDGLKRGLAGGLRRQQIHPVAQGGRACRLECPPGALAHGGVLGGKCGDE